MNGCEGCAFNRFIPTHVGNGMRPSEKARDNAVHPHACGERLILRLSEVESAGSSPRMWGTAS